MQKIFRRFWKELTIVEFMKRAQKTPLSTWGGRPKRTSKGGEEDATIIEICGKGKSKSVI